MKKDHEQILLTAKERFKRIEDYESDVREDLLRDWKFYYLKHWEPEDEKSRELNNKPSLVIPRINQFVHKVFNEFRQNKPAVKVSPRDARNKELAEQRIKYAENRAGVIRAINDKSQAVNAFQNAFDHAVIMGRGFVRVRTDWVSPKSMEQEIIIDKVKNPLNVFMDENRTKLDYSDCGYGFITEVIRKEDFKQLCPDANPKSWDAKYTDNWTNSDEITIAEYFYFEKTKDTLYQIEDDSGNTYEIFKSDVNEKDFKKIKRNVKKERVSFKRQLKWAKITSLEVLEEEDIPALDRIPIVPFIGQEEEVGGKCIIKGLIRDAKDSQKMYDYWASCEAEWLASYTKSQWVGDPRQIKGYEQVWQSDNVSSFRFLPVNSVMEGGQLLAPPQLNQPPQIPTGFIQGKMGCIDDMKATTGIHDASLGSQGNETSGRAILARQRESDTSNFHFTDNGRIAITSIGQIQNDWLPIYYDTQRVIEILGEEEEPDTIELYGKDKDGDRIEFGTGEYNVSVTMGPAFSTRRQEASEAMLEFMDVYQEAKPLMGDLVAKNMDWPGSQQIAKRLEALLPPGVKEGEEDEEMSPQVAQMQELIQQREQELQAMAQQLQDLERQKGNEEGKLMIEQQKIELEKQKIDLEKAKSQFDSFMETEKLEIEKGKLMLEAANEGESDAQIRAETELIKTQMQIEAQDRQSKQDNDYKKEGEINVKAEISKAIEEKQTAFAEENKKRDDEINNILAEVEKKIELADDLKSEITKTGDGSYTVKTTDGLGQTKSSIVKKTNGKWIIEDKQQKGGKDAMD